MPDARKPLQIKAFRASLTLVPAGYIAAADGEGGGYLALGLGEVSGEAVAAADHLRLPVGEAGVYQMADALLLLPVGHVREHGVIAAHHIHKAQGTPGVIAVDGVGQGHLPLQLFAAAKVHEHLVFHAPGGVGGQAYLTLRAEGVHSLYEADGADGDQVLLLGRLGIILFEDASLKANSPRS